MNKLEDALSDPELAGVTWLWKKDTWVNDRIVAGPLSSKKVDKQRERVLLGKDRLNFIFNHGKLIYQHHNNPNDPVIILGDCLAIGTDKVGKTFAVWGIAKGSESIDMAWGEMVQYGLSGGFSIGGKRTEKECKDGVCTLTDPEVTETSWTPRPANDDCTVYYINQFAKSMINKAVCGNDTYELKSQIRSMNKRLGSRFKVDPYFEVDTIQKNYPCARDYVMGMMEVGVKRDEAELMLDDYLTKIAKEVNTMEQETDETMTKLGEAPEPSGPAQTPTSGGNAALEQLGQLVNLLTQMNVKLDQLISTGTPMTPAPAEDGQEEDIEKEPESPEEEPKAPADGETKEPEGDDGEPEYEDEEKKKDVKKTDGSLDLAGGENPEPESPNPADTAGSDSASDTEQIDVSEGEDPEPEGPDPEMPDPESDKGDVDQEGNVTDIGDDDTSVDPVAEHAIKPEDLAKGLLKKKPAKVDPDQFLKENNFTMVKVQNRPKPVVEDPRADAMNQPEKYEKETGKSLLQKIKDGMFSIGK